MSRRSYGSIRRLPSGRWAGRYTGPTGERYTIGSHATKREAEAALAGVLADVHRGTYRAPERGAVPLSDYARRWIERRDVRPRTRHLYGRLLARWIAAPVSAPGRRRPIDLGGLELRALSPTLVNEWHAAVLSAATEAASTRATRAAARNAPSDAEQARAWARGSGRALARSGRLPGSVWQEWRQAGRPRPLPVRDANPDAGRTEAAQAYRLLRAMCTTALRERLIDANPCQIPRAGQTRAAERPTASPREVRLIAARMPKRYRAAVMVAAWSGLRAGELFALRRRDVEISDTGGVRLTVERQIIEVPGQPLTYGRPKSDAGHRTVWLPPAAAWTLRAHLAAYAITDPEQLLFTTELGTPVTARERTRVFTRARTRAGRPDLRWHDLRHTGATLAARSGATTRELMRRLGHSTFAAAMNYQHASDDADARLAERMAALEHARAGNVATLPQRASANHRA